MPFIPHTEEETSAMLAAIDVEKMADLFDEIPTSLLVKSLPGIPKGLSESQMSRLLSLRASEMHHDKCFIGAGAYEHHIPAAVWEIASRGEFLTNYTPYQAEASQGTLQLLWEYQTMIASLMGLEVSNASLHDGASSLAEAVLMACRMKPKEKAYRVFVPKTVSPFYRFVLTTILSAQNIEVVEIPYDERSGIISIEILDTMIKEKEFCTALVIPFPNFFGLHEKVHALTNWGHCHGAIVIGVVNPVLCAWLKPPGQWGEQGADLACGEAQPFGIPLSGGGPYLGFLCCKKEAVRQLPGRLVGRTVDLSGKMGFTLTLQAREQHIRRGKATSNICTNQGLLVTAAAIYLSLLGPKGLQIVAKTCYERMVFLNKALSDIPGLKQVFIGPHFHETVWQLPVEVAKTIKLMHERGFASGFALEKYYPNLKNTLLICVTETKTDEDIFQYTEALKETIQALEK